MNFLKKNDVETANTIKELAEAINQNDTKI